MEQGVRVLVQPSTRRIFPDEAYVEAGATVQEDLSEASVILAVKEVPIAVLIPNRTYCFFSHTKKAQVPFQSWLRAAMVLWELVVSSVACGFALRGSLPRCVGVAHCARTAAVAVVVYKRRCGSVVCSEQ